MSYRRPSHLAALALLVFVLVLSACPGDSPTDPPPAGPTIQVSANTRTFTANAGVNPPTQSIDITNAGTGTLSNLAFNVTYGSGGGFWLATTLNSNTAPARLDMSPYTGSMQPGSYTATITITSPLAGNTPQQVAVTLTINPSAGPTIGIAGTSTSMTGQSGSGGGQITMPIANVGPGTLSGLASSLTYQAGEPTGWLSASVLNTTAPSLLTLQLSAATLAAGTYHANVAITSPGATNSPRMVAVVFTVIPSTATPTLVLTPATHSFAATVGGANPAAKTVQVTNGATGTVSGLSLIITYQTGQPTGWLAGSFSTTTAPATLTLNATTGALPAGTYNAKAWVSSTTATNSPRAVDVTFTVTAPQSPRIGVSDTAIAFTAPQGGANPSPDTIQVTNTGTGTLNGLSGSVAYGAGQQTGWLTVQQGNTSAPTIFTFRATTGTRTAGTYTATLTITAPGADNSPRTVRVTFTVTAPAPPAAPTALLALAVSTTQINLSWVDASSNETAFKIDRCTGAGCTSFAEIASLGAGVTSYQNTGLAAATTYGYRVRAFSTAGSSPSSVVTATTFAPSPLIVLSPTSRSFSGTAGGASPASQAVQVSNGGGGTLNGLSRTISYQTGQTTSWLTASLSGLVAPVTLTLTANPATLAAGTYNATVSIHSTAATNTPRTVTVTFTVAPGTPTTPTTLRIINDLPGGFIGGANWTDLNTVIRVRIGPTSASVINFTAQARELLFNGDYTSDVNQTFQIPPGTQQTLNVSSQTGEYWVYIQTGWWEFFSETQLWVKHMAEVMACDGQQLAYKWVAFKVTAPYGAPEMIKLSEFLPAGSYGYPFCP